METAEQVDISENPYNEVLVLRLRGTFYRAINDDARVLSKLMGYQIVIEKSMIRCGFPKDSLEKILQECVSKKVNYVVFNGEEQIGNGNFPENQYRTLLCASEAEFPEPEIEKIRSEKKNTGKRKSERADSAGEIQKRTTPLQHVAVINGSGFNYDDAVIDMKTSLERSIIDNGFRIVSFSFSGSSTNHNGICLVKGICVYEKGEENER